MSDRMLSDEILLGLIKANSGGGGGGGTDDYNNLKNQPKIENVTLKGNMTAADLGLATATALADKVDKVAGKGLSTNDFTDAYKDAVDANTTAISGIKNGEEINSFSGVETALSGVDDAISAIDSKIDDTTTYPYADVITIPDAIPANLADCNVKIEPVQDLHGFDHPWVGGAGKNMLPMTVDSIKAANTSGTWSGNVYTISGTTFEVMTDDADNVTGIKINGTTSGGINFNLADSVSVPLNDSYKFFGCSGFSSGVGAITYSFNGASNIEVFKNAVTSTISGTFIHAHIYLWSGNTFNNVMVYPMFMLASESDDTFAPYTNYCPITGHTEASVQRDGKNFCPYNSMKILDGEYFTLPAGTYTFSLKVLGSNKYSTSHIGLYYDPNELALCTVRGAAGSVVNTQVTLAKSTQLYVRVVNMDADSNGYYCDNIQIELGQTATPYVPYAGKTYTIALGDTIYGGTVDFDSGVMTVTDSIVDLGTLTYTYDSTYNRFYTRLTGLKLVQTRTLEMTCECYEVIDDGRALANVSDASVYNGDSQDNVIMVHDSRYTDPSDLATALDGMQLVYPIATPTTIQLTPQQIQLLKGTNTITASTGDISVTVNGVSGAIGQVQEQVNGIAEDVAEIKPVNYSTTEQKTGQKWIDKDIFCIIVDNTTDLVVQSNTWTNTALEKGNIDLILCVFGTSNGGSTFPLAADKGTDYIRINSWRNDTVAVRYITIFYTKTT